MPVAMSYELQIPAGIFEDMQAYVKYRQPPGSFLEAVLTNDLKGAVSRADPECGAALYQIVQWFYWEAPGNCWGSEERVKAWLRGSESKPWSAPPDP